GDRSAARKGTDQQHSYEEGPTDDCDAAALLHLRVVAPLTNISPAKRRPPPRLRAQPRSPSARRTERRRQPLLPRSRIPPRPSEPAQCVRAPRTLLREGGGGAVPAAIPRRMPCPLRNARIRAWPARPARRASRIRGERLRGC